MGQPVVDTLRLSEGLRDAGVEPRQAEGMARVLGDELGEHVVVQKDLDAGFAAMGAEFVATRAEFATMGAEFVATRAEVAAMRAEFVAWRSEVNTKFNWVAWGIGLMLAFTSALIAIGLIDINGPSPAPVSVTVHPPVASGTAAPQAPYSAPVSQGGTAAEPAPPSIRD